MTIQQEALAAHLQAPSQLGDEISITGKWVPTKKGGLFTKSPESKALVTEWEAIHQAARNHGGMLSTEINHGVGQDAVLVHHVFKNAASLVDYFNTTAAEHQPALSQIAKPEHHLVKGIAISSEVKEALKGKNVDAAFGDHLFSYVKHDYQRPNPETAIQVTAKWTCKPGVDAKDELTYWWQMVGTDAFDMEKGLVRFEVYDVPGENALIIHETFDSTDELKFHLTKGTAHKYKKDIDKIAAPECYFFRGPVSWTIRTYSKFMGLPATYSSLGHQFVQPGGNMSDGLI